VESSIYETRALIVSKSNALPNLVCGKFGELLLGKLFLKVDNNAGAYYEDQSTDPFGCS
jgi:hypothetical protein